MCVWTGGEKLRATGLPSSPKLLLLLLLLLLLPAAAAAACCCGCCFCCSSYYAFENKALVLVPNRSVLAVYAVDAVDAAAVSGCERLEVAVKFLGSPRRCFFCVRRVLPACMRCWCRPLLQFDAMRPRGHVWVQVMLVLICTMKKKKNLIWFLLRAHA